MTTDTLLEAGPITRILRRARNAATVGRARALQWSPGRKLLVLLAFTLAAAGMWQFGKGAYIHVKAVVAQWLLERAWRQTAAGGRPARPWPWADTWPVARLSAPRQRVDLIVLAGASGRALAFAPGHAAGTPLPGERGNSVLGGHRDTHFQFLRDVMPGDAIVVERPDGRRVRYRVVGAQVLDYRQTAVMASDGPDRLTLVTCYPFDAVRPGGPLRYVVTAERARPYS